jgi:bifunctional DNase/RNase
MLRNIANSFAKLFSRRSPSPLVNGVAAKVRPCERCEKPQAIHVTRMKEAKLASEAHLCVDCAQKALWIPAPQTARPVTGLADANREVPVEVETVIISEVSDAQMIIFREIDGPRRLSFVLGIFEATTIDRTLKRISSPRPLTHNAWLDTIVALGFKVQAAGVHERRDDTYYATLKLMCGQETYTVDVRPSDALAVTLKAGAPFFFTEKVLAENSVSEPEPV